MAKVLLGVTGSVAAIRTPELVQQLRGRGHEVKVVATAPALYFFDPISLDRSKPDRNPEIVILDADEWPGLAEGRRWQRDEPVLHIELRRWADLFLIAPLDANTLAKLANGLADNCLTCVWRAWDLAKPLLLAPAMNTFMWQHPATGRHLRQLAGDLGLNHHTMDPDPLRLIDWINRVSSRLRIVPPQTKALACGDVGVGAMAALEDIVAVVDCALASK
jgi:phosphopantothenoylcysteine decarboxylase